MLTDTPHDTRPALASAGHVACELVGDEKQPKRVVTIRIEHDVWDALDQAAQDVGMDRSALLRQLARWFVGVPGAQLPPRREGGST